MVAHTWTSLWVLTSQFASEPFSHQFSQSTEVFFALRVAPAPSHISLSTGNTGDLQAPCRISRDVSCTSECTAFLGTFVVFYIFPRASINLKQKETFFPTWMLTHKALHVLGGQPHELCGLWGAMPQAKREVALPSLQGPHYRARGHWAVNVGILGLLMDKDGQWGSTMPQRGRAREKVAGDRWEVMDDVLTKSQILAGLFLLNYVGLGTSSSMSEGTLTWGLGLFICSTSQQGMPKGRWGWRWVGS